MTKKSKNATESAFANLGSFESLRMQKFPGNGNVVKGNHVAAGGGCAIEIHEAIGDQPSVVTHCVDGRIESIEFICTCGRTTTVKLEYAGE